MAVIFQNENANSSHENHTNAVCKSEDITNQSQTLH